MLWHAILTAAAIVATQSKIIMMFIITYVLKQMF